MSGFLWLGIALGLVFGAAVVLLAERGMWWRLESKVAEVSAEVDPVNTNRYGHRFAPVGEMRRQLPKLGDKHLWESWVDSSSGEPIFTLRLLESTLEGERVVAERVVNLARDGRPYPARDLYKTWQETYAKASYLRVEQARAGLVAPVLEWAGVQATRLYGSREGHEVRR